MLYFVLQVSQRNAGVALRVMPPGLVRTLKHAISTDARPDGRQAVTNLEATTVEAIDPRACRHANVEQYGGPSGRFRTCTKCRKR